MVFLLIEGTMPALRRGIGKGQATVRVDGSVVAEGGLLFALGERNPSSMP